MGTIAEVFRAGGVWMYAILAVTILGLLVQGLLGFVGLAKARLPAVALFLFPTCLLGIAALGVTVGVEEARAALESVTPENRSKMVMVGSAYALAPLWFALYASALMFSVGAFSSGLSAIFGASPERRFSPGSAGVGGVLFFGAVSAFIGAGFVLDSTSGHFFFGIALIALVAFGGALAAAFDSGDDDARARIVSGRWGVAVAGAMTALCWGGGASFMGMFEAFTALEYATPEVRVPLFMRAIEQVSSLQMLGFVGAGALLFAGSVPAVIVSARGVDSKHIIGGVLTAVAFGFIAACTLLAEGRVGALAAGSTFAEAERIVAEKGALPVLPPGGDGVEPYCVLEERAGGWHLVSGDNANDRQCARGGRRGEPGLERERTVFLDKNCSVAFGEVTAPVCPDTETTPVLIVPAPYPVAGFARRGWNGSGLNVDVLTRGSIEGDVPDELSPLLRWSVLYGAFGVKWVDTRPLQIAPDASPDDSTPELPPDVAREDRIVWEATFFGRYIEDYFAVVAVAASGDYVVATGYEVKEVPRKKLSSALADARDRATGQLPHRARGVLFLVDDSVDFSELARACEIGEEASPRGRRDDIYDYDASPVRCHVGAAAPDTWRAQIAAASERAATAKRDAANGDAGSGEGDGAGGVVRAAVGSSKPVILGALDKKEIQRVVRIKRNAVKYCYEKALVKDPELSGRVTVKFVISAQGRVSSAQIASSTLGSREVESCLTRQVKRWRFPKPRGGGIVIVKYPFSFST